MCFIFGLPAASRLASARSKRESSLRAQGLPVPDRGPLFSAEALAAAGKGTPFRVVDADTSPKPAPPPTNLSVSPSANAARRRARSLLGSGSTASNAGKKSLLGS